MIDAQQLRSVDVAPSDAFKIRAAGYPRLPKAKMPNGTGFAGSLGHLAGGGKRGRNQKT